jgi:hypothetical protein
VALRPEFVGEHIARQSQRLTSEYYPHRKHWPARLFHHAPLENAIAILQAGVLRSRNDPLNPHPRDVAAPDVINTRVDAHNYVRLYFRPKTPTQYSIEGIRKINECPYGEGTHAPFLVMFALDARTVLSQQDVRFSDRNMQIGAAISGDTEAYFSQIPFEKVFHEGNTGGDRSITDARSAEVLASSPLNLRECLREIYFRSEPERDTVLHMLEAQRDTWARICHVSDALKVFQKRHTFVQDVTLTPEGITFLLNPRHDLAKIKVAISIVDASGQTVADFYNDALDARPPGNNRWIYKHSLADGTYTVDIRLEDQLAYRAKIPLDSILF